MERVGPTPAGGVRPVDLVELSERSGPFATVWVGRSGMGPWGRAGDDIAAGDVLVGLRDEGVPDAVAVSVGDALSEVGDDARGVVVVADEGGVRVVEELPDPPRRELARWAPLPSLSPVLEHRQADIPVIVVLVDRTGADVVVRRPGGEERASEVEGGDEPVTKSAPGGWSQRRYQQRAEDSWEHNAAAVAEHVRELTVGALPDLIVLGGDQRAVTLVADALPAELHAVVRTITAGRAADGSESRREADIERLVDSVVAEETVGLLHAFEDQTGARAVNGVAATIAALQRSQVDVLFVHDDADDERTACVAPSAGVIGVERDELEAMGATEIVEGRLIDVAINAALRTGAAVRIVPDVAMIDDGLAAVLRWADASTSSSPA